MILTMQPEIKLNGEKKDPELSLNMQLSSTRTLSSQAKEHILQRLYGPGVFRDVDTDNARAFWRWYLNECRRSASCTLAVTHAELLDIVDMIRSGLTRAELQEKLRPSDSHMVLRDNRYADDTMNLAAMLLTTMEIGNWTYGDSDVRPIRWPLDKSLKEVVNDQFLKTTETKFNVNLEKKFVAVNLKRIKGLEIQWTWNLADHLRVSMYDGKLHIFHAFTCLEWQLAGSDPIVSKEVLMEARTSLCLLFPSNDTETKKWYKSEAKRMNIDTSLGLSGSLDPDQMKIETFTYFHDRLGFLKQLYDRSRPCLLKQLFCRREIIYETSG